MNSTTQCTNGFNLTNCGAPILTNSVPSTASLRDTILFSPYSPDYDRMRMKSTLVELHRDLYAQGYEQHDNCEKENASEIREALTMEGLDTVIAFPTVDREGRTLEGDEHQAIFIRHLTPERRTIAFLVIEKLLKEKAEKAPYAYGKNIPTNPFS